MTLFATPAQKTGATAKVVLWLGIALAMEGYLRNAPGRLLMGTGMAALGLGLNLFARRAA
jgi:hypothetical protein